MACQSMRSSWTFSSLIGAFLDLAIAYLLLCASALAFSTSRFLGFFGLRLPCPCNGLFGDPNCGNCKQRLLLPDPAEAISSVQLSVKSKFPLDFIWAKDRNYQLNVKLIRDRDDHVEGLVEMEGEGSCSSVSGTRKRENLAERYMVPGNESGKEGRLDIKGKGIINQRPRSGPRRRRKGVTDFGNVSSVLTLGPTCTDSQSPSSFNHEGCMVNDQSSAPLDSGVDDANDIHYDGDQLASSIGQRALHYSELVESVDANNPSEKNASGVEGIKVNAQKELDFDGDAKKAIKILEQALEEERAARAALYLELEKERNAAATAADEAMAMILRLQEGKASIEMEARQYLRIIEEKSAYDAEEMNILKEILLRREREKHFLENEVEAYRQMIYDRNQLLQEDVHSMVNANGEEPAFSLDVGEDPVLTFQQLSESIDKLDVVKGKLSVPGVTYVDKPNHTLSVGKKHNLTGWNKEADFPKQRELDKKFAHIYGSSQKQNFSGKMVPLSDDQEDRNDNVHQSRRNAIKAIETNATYRKKAIETNAADINILCGGENSVQHVKDLYQGRKDGVDMVCDMEPQVHDVHVIDDELDSSNDVKENKDEKFLENDISHVGRRNDLPRKDSSIDKVDNRTDSPSAGGTESLLDISRSSLKTTARLPPLGGSKGGKSVLSDQRVNSMPAVDNERLKIDSEVGWLRERLKVVQKEREKLNFSVDHQEREKVQLQLLDDIACQIREIRQLTEPGKAIRQASLPLPSSKVASKRRRCRSVSLEVDESS